MANTTTHTATDNTFLKGLESSPIWNLADVGDLTYSFAGSGELTTINTAITDSGRTGTAVAVTTAMQGHLTAALNGWAAVSGLSFTAEATFDDANFQFGFANSLQSPSGGLNGFMQFPSTGGESFGVFSTNTGMSITPETGAGAPVNRVSLHEIGHGLAMSHPHGTPGVPWAISAATGAGDHQLDNNRYTVMSYERGGLDVKYDNKAYGYSVTPMALDIAAIQAMYGVDTSTNTTATTYNLTDAGTTALDLDGSDGSVSIGRAFYSIWDNQTDGARDKIAYSGAMRVLINLNDATLDTTVNAEDKAWIDDLATSATVASDLPTEFKLDFFDSGMGASAEYHAGGFFSRVFSSATSYDLGGYSIAKGVVIEDADGSSGKDVLIGNQVANTLDGKGEADVIHGAGGDDTIIGGAGDDEMWGGAGNDDIDGGDGTGDVAAFSGLCAEYTVEKDDTTGVFTVTHITDGTDGTDTLRNIEKLKFADGVIDITGDGPYGCPPVDFIFLVDLSGSYSDDLANFVSNARSIAASVLATSPDSQFAIASFVDKPESPYGSAGDYLYRADLPLTASVADFEAGLAALSTLSGGDTPEAQYVGLWRAANGVGLNLREDTQKIILIATDAPAHSAADYGLDENTIRDFLETEGIVVAGDDAAAAADVAGEDVADDHEVHWGDEVGETPVDGTEEYGYVPSLPDSGSELFLETLASQFGIGNVAPIFAVTSGAESFYEGISSAFRRSSVVPISSSSTDIGDSVREALLELTSPGALLGDADDNLFEGTPGNDIYAGSRGSDTLRGGEGDDLLDGGADDDTVEGGGGADTLSGGTGADEIDGGSGDDSIDPGAGVDLITLGDGFDKVLGTLAELLGDTITDFTHEDALKFRGASLVREGLLYDALTGVLQVDSDGDGAFEGSLTIGTGLSGGDFMAARLEDGTDVSFHSFLAPLAEGRAVGASEINGIVNADFLNGFNITDMSVTFAANAAAGFSNTVGYYEIDPTGQLVNVTILAANAKTATAPIDITVSDPDNDIGFFLVQDGARRISEAGFTADSFEFVDNGAGGFDLASQGTVLSGVNVFFSHDADLNPDGMEHVMSGVSDDDEGALIIGFEDLLRNGRSDDDFQDVLLYVDVA
ncbi:DUF4114 domain-containing protein [Sagittula sp. NFXS13]|uniref:DUF4114 domain-containing protein n=1 Tax=Sagittula sp. NFXS13 TaxID=2819095 RepID=UPI0032DF69E1